MRESETYNRDYDLFLILVAHDAAYVALLRELGLPSQQVDHS